MKLTLLQWNIWYREDVRDVAKFLGVQKADIICLQEIPSPEASDLIAGELGYHYSTHEVPIEAPDGTKQSWSIGVFSQFPIVAKKFHWLNEPTDGGGYGDEFRAYLEVVLVIGDDMVTVGTTHLSYTHKFADASFKKAESDRLAAAIKDKKKQFILAGDFNTPPDSYLIKQLEKHLVSAGPDFGQNTWTTKPFSYNGFEEKELNWRLDYVFATEDLVVKSAKVLQTELSDHLPIKIEVILE